MDTQQSTLNKVASSALGGKLIAAPNSVVAKEKAAIDHELSVLHQAIERSHQIVTQIETAVASVTSSLPPSDNSIPSHDVLGSSRVYLSIHEAVSGLHYLEDRAFSIIHNLEV